MSGVAMETPDEHHLKRTLRERTKYLRILTKNVDQFLKWIDAEMQKPSTHDRGKRVAQACNALDLSNQHAKRFGLGRRVTKAGMKRVFTRVSEPTSVPSEV